MANEDTYAFKGTWVSFAIIFLLIDLGLRAYIGGSGALDIVIVILSSGVFAALIQFYYVATGQRTPAKAFGLKETMPPPAPPTNNEVVPPRPSVIFGESQDLIASLNMFLASSSGLTWEIGLTLSLPPDQDSESNRAAFVHATKSFIESFTINGTSYRVPEPGVFVDALRPQLGGLARTLSIPQFFFSLSVLPADVVLLGYRAEDAANFYCLPYDVRTKHLYITGKSQHGKSTILLQCAYADIGRGKGIAVIDPHGDLVESLLNRIHVSRVDDVIYLDAENAVPINFMSYANEREKEALVGDIIFLLQRFPGWGPRMDSILRNVLYTLLEAGDTCFLDIYYFLVDENRRKQILKRVHDPDLLRLWNNNFPRPDALEPIISRMTTFVRSPSLKTYMAGGEKQLDIFEIMQTGKILLVNLVKSGRESGDILGSLIVSKIQQAAMRRYSIPPEQRKPFYLYTDEFERFQTTSFDIILSEAGKFKLGLVMANQFVDQLDKQILSSVLGNVSSFLLFRMDERDASYFIADVKQRQPLSLDEFVRRHETFPPDGTIDSYTKVINLSADSLSHLPPGKALYKTADGQSEFIIFPKSSQPITQYAETIKKRTIELYTPAACNIPQVLHHVGNDEEPTPGAAPTHHERKERGA